MTGLVARVFGRGIIRFISDGIEVDDGQGGRRNVTALDLFDGGETDHIQQEVGKVAVREFVNALADAHPDDVMDLVLGMLLGCRIGNGDVPEDDEAAARQYIDVAAGVSWRGLMWIVGQQMWLWGLPTSPGGDTVGHT